MKLRYLTPLVLALITGVLWSVNAYLEADRELRAGLRLERLELPERTWSVEQLGLPTAQVLPPTDQRASS